MKRPASHFCPLQSSDCSSIPHKQLQLHKLRRNLSYLRSSLGYKACQRDAWHSVVLCLSQGEVRGGHQPYTSWDFHQTPHRAPCLVLVPPRSEPAASQRPQDHCLLSQSHKRSVLKLQIILSGCYRRGNVPMTRESLKPTRPRRVVLVFNRCSFRFCADNPPKLLLATQQCS